MSTPCYKCEDRFQGCHSVCPKYKEFVAERKRILAIKRKEIDDRNDFNRLEHEKYLRLKYYRKSKDKKK